MGLGGFNGRGVLLKNRPPSALGRPFLVAKYSGDGCLRLLVRRLSGLHSLITPQLVMHPHMTGMA